MANYNRVILGGNLTRDPELRFTSSGKPVCDFTLALNRGRGNKDTADYVQAVTWEDLAQTIAEHKEKGHGVIVEGRLRYDSWEGESGQKRSKVEVVADKVQFMPEGSSMSLNKVVLAGNLTRDPELEEVGSEGIHKATFGLAVSRGSDAVDFFNVTAWRGLADAITEYKKNGHPVLVDGRLQYSSWENGEGQKRSRVEVVAESVGYLGNKNVAASSSKTTQSAASVNGFGSGGGVAAATAVADDEDERFDDIPF